MADRLWCCHTCKLIGSAEQAERHELASPECNVVELSQEISDAVRAEREKQQPHPTAADYLFARFKQRVAANG